jgi:hypothetical protein
MLYARHDLTGLLPIISPSHGDRTECPSSTALGGNLEAVFCDSGRLVLVFVQKGTRQTRRAALNLNCKPPIFE